MARGARPPAVAGQFYAADGAELAREVERCFTDARGPGALPTRFRSPERHLAAAVVPHAGLLYSGAIAAHVYARVAAERPPESVLVLGVDHHGVSRGAALSDRPWATPLGPTAVSEPLVRALDRPPITIDERAHANEHSIEVQLPFLEYVLPKPKFAALEVGLGSFEFLESVASVVRTALDGRDCLVLASSDLSHYLPVETARRLDGRAIDAILSRDPRRLYDTVVGEGISMCGIAPVTVLLAALAGRSLSASRLAWGHSGEVVAMREVVGYSAIAFESDAPLRPSVK
jgi:MEMO1 family protein